MFALVMYRSTVQTNLRRFSACITNKSNGRMKNPCCNLQVKPISVIPNDNFTHCRSYSNESETQSKYRSQELMDFPALTWPNWFNIIYNVILLNFVIKRELDENFNVSEFIQGSREALRVVSRTLASGDLEDLSGLVTDDTIEILKESTKNFSLQQKNQMAVDVNDITYNYIYEINLIRKTEEEIEKKFVQITMIYHVVHGYSNYIEELKNIDANPTFKFTSVNNLKDNIFIWNCRFIRDYTNGVDAPWVINMITYFRPVRW